MGGGEGWRREVHREGEGRGEVHAEGDRVKELMRKRKEVSKCRVQSKEYEDVGKGRVERARW